MGSHKKNKKINENKNTKPSAPEDGEFKDLDELIAHIDELNRRREEMSSKTKELIKGDKEAISKMKEDKKDNAEVDKALEDTEDKESSSKDAKKESPKKESLKKENNKKESIKKESIKEESKSDLDDITQEKTDDDDDELDYLDDDESSARVKLDFFDNDNRTQIRKENPNYLRHDNKPEKSLIVVVGAIVAALFVCMFVALGIDSKNKVDDETVKIQTLSKKFIDEKTIDKVAMMQTVNDLYAALDAEDNEKAKSYIYSSNGKDDEGIDEGLAKLKEDIALSKKLTGTSQMNFTECYIQKGLHKNEYIVYMKFIMNISGVSTPAPGIYRYYMIDDVKDEDKTVEETTVAEETTGDTAVADETTSEAATEESKEPAKAEVKHNYKLMLISYDSDSEIYSYMAKMQDCNSITALFKQVNKEYNNALENDSQLKAIVDALENKEDTKKDNKEETTEAETTTEAVSETIAEETTAEETTSEELPSEDTVEEDAE